jgi:DNA (cytosine-5)-methyltransferase 1
VTGVDISEKAVAAFRLNNKGRCIQGDILKELIVADCDIIVGGPSCKPWSAVNLTRRGKRHKDYELLNRFFEHIRQNSPEMFLMENVPLIAHETNLWKNFAKLERDGYSIKAKSISYGDYGAPTKRRRFIAFGSRKQDSATFFEKLSRYERSARPIKNVIWDLRNKENGQAKDHVWPELKTIDRYKPYYESGKYGWCILKWMEPAPSFGNVMKTYTLHPNSYDGGQTRVISVREAFLVMGFDPKFHFPEGLGLGLRYQMVVDAVSPVFSRVAAKVMKDLMSN